jgi:hypothetical protein
MRSFRIEHLRPSRSGLPKPLPVHMDLPLRRIDEILQRLYRPPAQPNAAVAGTGKKELAQAIADVGSLRTTCTAGTELAAYRNESAALGSSRPAAMRRNV